MDRAKAIEIIKVEIIRCKEYRRNCPKDIVNEEYTEALQEGLNCMSAMRDAEKILPVNGGKLHYQKGTSGYELKLLNDGFNTCLAEVTPIIARFQQKLAEAKYENKLIFNDPIKIHKEKIGNRRLCQNSKKRICSNCKSLIKIHDKYVKTRNGYVHRNCKNTDKYPDGEML